MEGKFEEASDYTGRETVTSQGEWMVAIQGERGSFSEEAAERLLGEGVQIRCCEHFDEVFRLAAAGNCRYCVVPIENALSGSIHKNYDLLLRNRLHIVREIHLRIRHHLIVLPGVSFEEIDTVLSHPVALDQCERFFQKNPRLVKRSAYDTSGSVRRLVREGCRRWGAIAGERAAKVFGAQILLSNIQDNEENFTRFFLLSARPEVLPDADKTSIVFSFPNAPGRLMRCLGVFAHREIDLTRIESRPIHGRPWEYLFYVDFLANAGSSEAREALGELEDVTEFLEVLGCYPRAPTPRSHLRDSGLSEDRSENPSVATEAPAAGVASAESSENPP